MREIKENMVQGFKPKSAVDLDNEKNTQYLTGFFALFIDFAHIYYELMHIKKALK